MDFIPPITNPTDARRAVPWFSPRGQTYTAAGLEKWLFYPHYEGYNLQHIVEGDFHGKTWAEAAGFVQRWAYYGMIEEILHIGGLRGVMGQTDDWDAERLSSFAKTLPYTLLLWQCVAVDSTNPQKEQLELQRFLQISLILKRVNSFYTALCSREFSRRYREDEEVCKPQQSQLLYATHSHAHEEPHAGGWDEYARRELGGERSFFSEEPVSGEGDENHLLESPGHALVLSIGAAGELLCRATELKYGRKVGNLKWMTSITIVRRMALANWCPIWLRRMRDEGSIIRAAYLSSISRGAPARHSKCCYFGCIASQVNVLTYQAKHRSTGCACKMISFDVGESSEAAAWLRSLQMPLVVRRRDRASGAVKWELLRSHDLESGIQRRYVAISHVWVDGTGSVDGNSLFSCQLDKFQNVANELYKIGEMEESVPFWVDTICVPFSQGPLKMLAIREMAQVYKNADKVLVFDSGLQQISLSIPARECLTHVEISSWNERLWTIQEAVFAKALYFQFEDGVVSLRQLIFRYRLERFSQIGQLVAQMQGVELSGGLAMLQFVLKSHLKPVMKGENLFQPPPGVAGEDGDWIALDADALEGIPSDTEIQGLQLDTIFLGTVVAVSSFFDTLHLSPEGEQNSKSKWASLEKVLPYRQTSIASDEGLCISTLLGMDLEPLFDLPDEQRVSRLFLHIGTINSGLLFGSRPRLDQPGHTWMPTSFINQRIELSARPAQVTEAGVRVKLCSIKIEFPPGGFLLEVQPGNRAGPFGFAELDDDDDEDDGPGHLVAAAFPIHLSGTNKVYTVWLTLPDGTPAIQVSQTGMIILLEQELDNEETPPMAQELQSIYREWDHLQEKSIVEGFLVQGGDQDKHVVQYGLPATLTTFDDPTLGQIEAAALARLSGEEEWVIS